MNHEIKFIYKKMKTRIIISSWKPIVSLAEIVLGKPQVNRMTCIYYIHIL